MDDKKIFISDISRPLEEALVQQFKEVEGVALTKSDNEAGLIVTSKADNFKSAKFLITPILVIEDGVKYRISDLLIKAIRMLQNPAQYLGNIDLGKIRINLKDKLAVNALGQEVALTDKEAEILYYMLNHNGKHVTKDNLLKDVWNYQEGVDSHTLETHIYRLRKKIEENADNPEILRTEDNGYILEA